MAPCSIHSFDDLVDCLQKAVEGQPPSESITLGAQLFDETGELAGLFGAPTLTITQRDAATKLFTYDATSATLVGTAKPLFAAAKEQYAYAVEVTCTYDRAPVLALTATPVPGQSWTFAGNFAADFPDYEGFDPPYVTTLPSFIPGVAFSDPSFAAITQSSALTYAASVDLSTGSLAPLAPYLGQGPVKVTGSLEVRATPGFPKLDLSGPLGYEVPKLASVALRIATQDGDPAASIIELTASVAPGDYHALDISAPLLRAPYAWRLTGEPANPDAYSLAAGIQELGREVGTPLSLPTGLDGLSSLYLQAVVVGFEPAANVTALDLIGLRFGTLKGVGPVWSAPILGLRIDQVGIGWDVVRPMSGSPELLGQLTGKLGVGPAKLDVQVSLSGLTTATTPDVGFVVSLDPDTKLTVDGLFEQFAGVSPGIGVDITDLILQGRTGTRSLQFVAGLEPHWPDLPGGVNLLELTLAFDYAPNAITAQTAARVKLLDLEWMLTAAYRGAGLGWRFSGALVPNAQANNLQTIVNALAPGWFPDPLPANLGSIELRGLSASFETKGSDYSFDGTLGWPFKFPTLGLDLDIEAGVSITKSGQNPPSGSAHGTLKVNELALGVVYSFDAKSKETVAFTVGYRGAELTCVISKNDKDETILRAHLGGVSFGDIVGFLVGLAEDRSGFRLPAPWDVLYQLTFDRLSLEVNLTTRAIGVSYRLDVDLGIVKLDAINLTYSKYGGSSSVVIGIEGTFFGTTYGPDSQLSWDMLNEPPPSPPGKGEALLDLRFLAIGQSVAMRRTTRFTGVADAITELEKDFTPVKGDGNPLPQLPALKFSGDGRWLIGADFTVMSAVSISGVFVDPSLYGIRIGLAGERVKKLAGLQFEVLYQKVTDTIGLYHIELTLPTAMRNLQFGAVAVTLPIVTVDIYTNGNFHLDFGFPEGRRLQPLVLGTGRLLHRPRGLLLRRARRRDLRRVPVPTNGAFSPVIVFGIGLSVGVGRTLEAGPISGRRHDHRRGHGRGRPRVVQPERPVAARGHLLPRQGHDRGRRQGVGVVDFVVVKASLSVTAYASVTLTVEAYKAIQVQLTVGVEVSASLTILFFTVSFSFSTSLDLSFTIGSDSTAPWRIATGGPAERPLQLRQQRTLHRPRATSPLELQRRVRERSGVLPEFDWTAQAVMGEGPVEIDLTLVPALTPASGSDGAPAVQVVMSLFVDTATPSGAMHAHEVVQVEHAEPEQVAFNLLAAGVLRWAIASLRTRLADDGDVTIGDLDAIARFLADRRNRDATFTYENVTSLLEHNFVLRVSNPIGPDGTFYDPRSDSPRGASAQPPQKALFPMIPEIEMKPDGRPPVTFIEHAIGDQAYRDRLETYYDQLLTAGPDRSNGGNRKALASGGQAVSVTLFCDYFGLLAQQAVHLAARTFDAYPYEPTGTESLLGIARSFGGWQVEHRVRAGDTLATIASEHGTTLAELRRANDELGELAADDVPAVGSAVAVEAGPTVARIAVANADYPLRTGAQLTVKGVRHQVRGTQTLGQIAAPFGITDLGALFATEQPTDENARSTALLQPGAQLSVPQLTYTVVQDDFVNNVVPASEVRERIAANFYVRTRQPTQVTADQVDWYVAAIGASAPGFTGRIDIPVATLDNGNLVDTGGTTPYVVKPSDTVRGVAAAFAQIQLRPSDPGFQAYLAKVTPGPFAPGTKVSLPAVALALESGDTFESLAATLYLAQPAPPAGLDALARANASTQVLAQHAVLALPTVTYTAVARDTLATVAERLDLSVDDLADSAADDAGILAPYAQTQRRLSVPHVATRDLDTLIGDLTRFGSLNTLSTTVSRFLLSGMQAPLPVPPTEPLEEDSLHGLYDLAGQQFPAPTGASAYDIDFKKSTTASWFCFDPAPGERAQAGPEGCADELLVTLTPAFLAKHAPSTVLDPQTVAGPTAMRLYDLDPPRYPLEQHMPWQPAADVPLPGPTGPSGPSAGGPSLWLFPSALQQAAGGPTGATAATRPYELLARSPAPPGATSVPVKPVRRFSWATAIPLRIARALDDTGAVVPGAYEVTGADQASRDLLLKAWSYLELSSSPRDRLYLLRRPSGASDNSSGLMSDVIDPAGTFLLRANLSTETHSNQAFTALAARANDSQYYARIASIGAFLREVWEASITGTGGFHLSYASAAGGGLPEELFATDGNATLWALLLLDRQSHGTTPERGLFRFNNCAVVAENLDASATSVYAELREPLAGDLRAIASVPAGVVGFGLTRRNPGGVTGAGPTGLTRQLHSLVGYRVRGGEDFEESHAGLPVSPLDEPPEWLGPTGGSAHAYWSYVQGIPVSRLGRVNDTPSSPALPLASASPYRGVTGPSPGFTRPLSTATVDLAFHDVYGNTTTSTHPLPSVDVPVGYTDDVIGISAWPGSGMDYLFRAAQGRGALLDAALALHAERYIPGEGNPVEHARNAARGDAERYAAVFYQLAQCDVDVALSSNIGAPQPLPGDLKAACSAFVTKAKLFADTTALLREQSFTTAGGALGALRDELGVSAGMLLGANPDVDATALFPELYVKPKIVAAPPMNTLTSLGAEVRGRSGKAPAERTCSGVTNPDDSCDWRQKPTGATPIAVASDNAGQPLTPGVFLRTNPRTSPPLVSDRLSVVAAALGTAVYAEVVVGTKGETVQVGLVPDNWTATGLIADGIQVTIDGVVHPTKNDTFESLFLFFQGKLPQVTKGDLAGAVRNLDGLLVAGKTVAYAALVVPPPAPNPPGTGPPEPTYSLADVPAAAGKVDELATLNAYVTNFFNTGAPILLGWSCCKVAEHSTPTTLARDAGISLNQFAAYNLPTVLGSGVALTIPDLVALDETAECWTAYAPKPSDTLDTVATALGTTPDVLAAVNRQLLGVLEPEAPVTVDGKQLSVVAGDTLESLYERFSAADAGLTWERFVQQLAQPANAGALRQGGAVAAPLPPVPATDPAIEDLAGSLNVDPVALVEANRSLRGFLRAGATIAGPDGATVTAGAYETVETVLWRLRAKHPDVTAADLVKLNGGRTGLLTAGRRVLVPPQPTVCTMPFAPQVPPAGATGEDRIVFPVQVTATVRRAPGLVHPDFARSESVELSASPLAPRIGAPDATTLTLDEFAARFEEAFAGERLKCAVAGGASATPSPARIWAVNLGPEGIARLAVDPSRPAFYALRPLSTEPLSRELTFKTYVSGQGLGPTATQRFSGVDLDAWMRQLLDTVDLALTPSYSVPAFRIGATGSPPLRAAVATPANGDGPRGIASELSGDATAAVARGATPTAPNGPAAYDRLVQAKGDIAGALRDRVGAIVQAPGATGHYNLAAAREAVYQQMLVRLSDAYDVSAVVQFPVNVVSPMFTPRGPTGTHPPRASGKVVPVRHSVAAEPPPGGSGAAPDSLAGVADGFGVSAPFLAEVIADMAGLLKPDVVIHGHTVDTQDTLARIARLAQPLVDPSDWDAWSAWVAPFATQSVFVEAASFPVSQAARLTAPGESLGDLAEFFGRDPGSVARANESTPGIVAAGPLQLARSRYPAPYDVRPADTLPDVAAGISSANPIKPALTLDSLAFELAPLRGKLTPGVELRIVETLPEMSLSTAKVSLGPMGATAGPPPPLTFLVTVKHAEEQRNLLLNLDFAINEFEYSIRDVPGAGNYQASSWLTLVRPFDPAREGANASVSTAVAQVQIPIPLRAYPSPPLLTGQSGLASAPGATAFPAVRQWDYRYDFAAHSAAQDAKHLKVVFGEQQRLFGLAEPDTDVSAALAAFITAYPALSADLGRLAGLPLGSQDPIAGHAMEALSLMARAVADKLAGSALGAALARGATAAYGYEMTTLDDGINLESLTLIPELGPTGASAVWPTMYVRRPDGSTGPTGADSGFEEMPGAGGVYRFPLPVGKDSAVTYRARFTQRDVIFDQTGRGSIGVSRNDRLIAHGPLGPTGSPATVPTYNDFIYRTPLVEFVDPLVPLIDNGAPIDVAGLGAGGKQPLWQRLLDLMRAATSVVPRGTTSSQLIELLCAYGFDVAAAGSDSIAVTSPIRLLPATQVGPSDVEPFTTALSKTLHDWYRSSTVDPNLGYLAMELSVFTFAQSRLAARPSRAARVMVPGEAASAGPVGATSAPPAKPILRLTNLRLDMASIDWSVST